MPKCPKVAAFLFETGILTPRQCLDFREELSKQLKVLENDAANEQDVEYGQQLMQRWQAHRDAQSIPSSLLH